MKAFHSRIVKWCKFVRARYGHRGVRVGEATNPGPPKSANGFEILSSVDDLEVFATVPASSGAVRAAAKSVRSSRRRRTRKLRALPWSSDSDTDSADEQSVARRVGTVVEAVDDEEPLGRDFSHGPGAQRDPELFAMSDHAKTPQDVLDALEQDLLETEGPPRLLSRVVGGRRLVLVPQSPRGTPRSVQDAMSEAEEVFPGALRSRNDQNFGRELVTECPPHIESRRRSSLIWRPDPVPVDPDIPDSHDRRLSRVRRAMQLERQRAEFGAEAPEYGPECIRRGWEAMDGVDLQAEFRCRVRCLQGVPSFLRGQFRSALVTSLEAMRSAYGSGDYVLKCRSWKVFRLTSRMLLWRHQHRGPSKAELERRMGAFQQEGEVRAPRRSV